uniref:ATP synthase F0 subunit 8 n=1 Tax=Xestocephalus ishidae TaxID=3112139 RepID=UPI002E794916|nr:ATP synthase F0 subunit 8 [Xestocephalus ishidae]WRK21248.1 ATP synthase F0 subunit 8 [Xestocephalus ishidae]
MPQMSPMWWLTMMLIIMTMMTITNSMIYFFNMTLNTNKKKTMKNKFNWKW